MNSQAIVAIIMAAALFVFMLVNGPVVRGIFITGDPSDAVAQAWKDIMNVMIGALAGYMSGGVSKDDK